MPSMLEDKMKERDGSYRFHLRQNKMIDMTDRLGAVYLKKKTTRDMTDRIGAVYVKIEQET